jgi:hypothetical protein
LTQECIYNTHKGSNIIYTCNKCQHINDESWQFVIVCRINKDKTPCVKCIQKENKTSFMEKELCEFIKSLDAELIENNRTIIAPYELDIFLPKRKIAFEFNGLYFHSEINKPLDYHIKKTEMCEMNNIQLVHIFEDDWLYRNKIVKSRIASLLGFSTPIYARKCIIGNVNNKDASLFLEENHIQGVCPSKHRLGLYYQGELVSLMTLGKSRFENDKYELLRFCNKINLRVIGGASKLFKYFIDNNDIQEIISYADRCWSLGNLYTQLKFDFVGKTLPNYAYVVGNQRESRIKHQKHKLVELGYDKEKTEHEIMLSRELYRIYDSGNLKFSYKKVTIDPSNRHTDTI